MVDVDDFLEHHGVKGMKWGVRRKKDFSNKEPKTAAEKAAFRKKVILGVTIGTGVAATGLILAYSKNKKVSDLSSIKSLTSKTTHQVTHKDLMDFYHNHSLKPRGLTSDLVDAATGKHPPAPPRVSLSDLGDVVKRSSSKSSAKSTAESLSRLEARTRMAQRAAEHRKFVAQYSARQNEIIKAANANSRKMDTLNEIPFHLREYIPEWK